jgi:two-component system sensor histidine kinase DesK
MRNNLAEESSDDGQGNGERRPAPRLARVVVTTVFGGLCLVATLNILEVTRSPARVLLAFAAMGALLTVQLFFLTERARRLGMAARIAIVAVQALVGFLPFLAFGQSWVGMPGFVAGGALLMLPWPYSIATFVLAVLATGGIQAGLHPSVLLVAYTTVSTVLTGLIVYGLSRMSILVGELHETRAEIARLAVFKERLRFARDLHDLLGYSLSAVTLKSELTRRLVGKNPERALVELEEIREISRQALADVRMLASGYRDMSLEDEARSARSVLVAADITVTMDIAHPPLPRQLSTVLATVLREGVTNLLQHSKAENCRVVVAEQGGRVRMTIANDGASERPAEPSPHGGSGIRNLSSRASAIGGSLSTVLREDGWFQLCAELPLVVPEQADGAEVVPLWQSATTSRLHVQSG